MPVHFVFLFNFLWIRIADWDRLLSVRTFFCISCKASKLAADPLSFCLSGKVFSSLFWKITLMDIGFLVDSCFTLSTLNMSFRCLLLPLFLLRSQLKSYCPPLSIIIFSLADFKIFSLSLGFSIYTMLCLFADLFTCISLGSLLISLDM